MTWSKKEGVEYFVHCRWSKRTEVEKKIHTSQRKPQAKAVEWEEVEEILTEENRKDAELALRVANKLGVKFKGNQEAVLRYISNLSSWSGSSSLSTITIDKNQMIKSRSSDSKGSLPKA
ncbi:hypothetical protein QQ045_005352 [Rhodiola kirilowii]